MTTVQLDKSAVRNYLDNWRGASGRLGLSTFNPIENQSFPTDRIGLDTAAEKIAEWDTEGRPGIYVRFFTTVAPGVSGRGEARQSVALVALAADVDYGTVGHATGKPLPPDEESARLVVAGAGLPNRQNGSIRVAGSTRCGASPMTACSTRPPTSTPPPPSPIGYTGH